MSHQPVMSGWLTKRGKRVKSWKSRWFVLDGLVLRYYATAPPPQTSEKGHMDLREVVDVRISTPGDLAVAKRTGTMFTVMTTNRTFYILADSEAVRDRWIDALSECLRQYQAQCREGAERDYNAIVGGPVHSPPSTATANTTAASSSATTTTAISTTAAAKAPQAGSRMSAPPKLMTSSAASSHRTDLNGLAEASEAFENAGGDERGALAGESSTARTERERETEALLKVYASKCGDGDVVRLRSKATGGYLGIDAAGEIDGDSEDLLQSHFRVMDGGLGSVVLQSVDNEEHRLAVNPQGRTVGTKGSQQGWQRFQLVRHGSGFEVLVRSMQLDPKHVFVAVGTDGSARHNYVMVDASSLFVLEGCTVPGQARELPLRLLPPVDTLALAGGMLQLECQATGKYLAITSSGAVTGNGGSDSASQFRLIPADGGLVILESMSRPKYHLCMVEGDGGGGRGGAEDMLTPLENPMLDGKGSLGAESRFLLITVNASEHLVALRHARGSCGPAGAASSSGGSLVAVDSAGLPVPFYSTLDAYAVFRLERASTLRSHVPAVLRGSAISTASASAAATQHQPQPYLLDFDSSYWKLVRRAVGKEWHASRDSARGLVSYGEYQPNPKGDRAFSLRYVDEEFDELLFATGDMKHWAMVRRYHLEHGTGLIPMVMTSERAGPHRLNWPREGEAWFRAGASESTPLVYGEGSSKEYTDVLREHEGANVFVRMRPTELARPPTPLDGEDEDSDDNSDEDNEDADEANEEAKEAKGEVEAAEGGETASQGADAEPVKAT